MVAELFIPQSGAEWILELVDMLHSPYVKKLRATQAAHFDDTRLWVDPNGYTLSDRIWNQKTANLTWIDDQIQEALRNGDDAIDLARKLETGLHPALQPVRTANGRIVDTGAKGVLTSTPRGGRGSYSARRLARTEITRAHGQTTDRSAEALGVEVRWALSNRHPKQDICDENARGSSPGRPMGVYSVKECPPYPAHPHCLCTKTTFDDRTDDEILEHLRAKWNIPKGPLPPPAPVKKKPGPPKGYKYPAGAKKPGPKPKPKHHGPPPLTEKEAAQYKKAALAKEAAAKKAAEAAEKKAKAAAFYKAKKEAAAKIKAKAVAEAKAKKSAEAAAAKAAKEAAAKAAAEKKLLEAIAAQKKAAAAAAKKKLADLNAQTTITPETIKELQAAGETQFKLKRVLRHKLDIDNQAKQASGDLLYEMRDYHIKIGQHPNAPDFIDGATKPPLKQIPVDEINGVQQNAAIDHLVKYLNKPAVPGELEVYRFMGEYWIRDGHHRLAASAIRGDKFITAEYFDLDEIGAKLGIPHPKVNGLTYPTAAMKAAEEAALKKAASAAKKKAAIQKTNATKKAYAELLAKQQAEAAAKALQASQALSKTIPKTTAAKKPAAAKSGILPSGVTAPKKPVPVYGKYTANTAKHTQVGIVKPETITDTDVASYLVDSDVKEIVHYAGGYNATASFKASGANFSKVKYQPGEELFSAAGLPTSTIPMGLSTEVRVAVRTKSPMTGTTQQLHDEIDSWNLPTAGLTEKQIAEDIRKEAIQRGYDSIVELLPGAGNHKNVYIIRHDNYKIIESQTTFSTYTPPPITAPKPGSMTYAPKPTKLPPPKDAPIPGAIDWKPKAKPAAGYSTYTEAQLKKKYAADADHIETRRHDAEMAPWKDYKISGYIAQNKYLRWGHPEGRDGVGLAMPDKRYFNPDDIPLMDTVMGQYHLEKQARAYRGVAAGSDIQKLLGNAQPGAIVTDHGYMSVSYNTTVAEAFASGAGDSVIYVLDIPPGTPYVPLDGLNRGMTEQELVLPRSTRLLIDRVESKKDPWGNTEYRVYASVQPPAPAKKPKAAPKKKATP